MDPTFGGQELLESLSQTSVRSRQSKDSRASKGGSSKGGNSSNSTITSAHTNPVEDAYRRIGQGLSQRAQGEDDRLAIPRQRARMSIHPNTSFEKYSRPNKKPFNPHDAVEGHPVYPQGGPSPKIAKIGQLGHFQDQHHTSEHPTKSSQRYLKKITLQAKETFQKWKRQQKAGYLNKYSSATLSTSASSGTTSSSMGASLGASYQQQYQQQQQLSHGSYDSASPQRFAFSQLALQQHENAQHQHMFDQHNPYIMGQGHSKGPPPTSKGLLSAVLEGGSESTYESESIHSLPTISSNTAVLSKSSSKQTAASLGAHAELHQYPGPSTGNDLLQAHSRQTASAAPALHFSAPRGLCLTQPSEPVSNDGLDNLEGNMILHQNDILIVPGQTKGRTHSKMLEFHVQSLLGQGTFAQVFCCWESVSKKHVALKIIKNKPAFTKQAAVEIEVFQALAKRNKDSGDDPAAVVGGSTPSSPHMVHLISSFMYKSHLCLVFEQLGLNLYEVLKKRQFRGLPLPMVRTLVKQAMEGVKELASKTIVHCDLKPENILLLNEDAEKEVIGAGEVKSAQQKEKSASSNTNVSMVSTGSILPQIIKLIDFGSACFEGYSAHTYIQSRFYRSPEVLIGLPYDSAIDMWSLGCVAAELFLGLPILPGVHEHDQCGRIVEMIGHVPDWMLEQGSKSSKYYVKYVPRSPSNSSNQNNNSTDPMSKSSPTPSERPMLPQWRMKTQTEYINSLSDSEIRKKGGLEKLKKQPANRYFKRTKLSDIVMLHGQHCTGDEKEMLGMFVHFLYGVLEPDPWKRWTAYQASQHPFLTGVSGQLRKKVAETKLDPREENHANLQFDVFWVPPWDPGICRRKLLNVQKIREKQNAQRRGYSQPRSHGMDAQDSLRAVGPDRQKQQSPGMNSRSQPMTVADSPSVISHMSVDGKTSPPSQIAQQNVRNTRGSSAASTPMHNILTHSSSLSEIGPSILQTALAAEDPNRSHHNMQAPSYSQSNSRALSGPQSFTSLGYEQPHKHPTEGDFAYALQRPGNIPMSSDTATVASQQSGMSIGSLNSSQGQSSQQQIYGRMSQSSLQMHSPMDRGGVYSSGNHSSSISSLPSSGGYSNPQQMPGMIAGVSYQGGYGNGNNSFDQPSGLQYLAQQQGRANNLQRSDLPQNVVMSEYHHQLLLQEQQKQLAALQQQHQQQLAALQQQQQLAFQQQQQQYINQYGATGNGYFYVTSSDGTPMLMQSSMDGSGTSYLMHQQQPQRSFDDDGSHNRSVRDNRSRQMRGGQGRRPNNDHRGGTGMSM